MSRRGRIGAALLGALVLRCAGPVGEGVGDVLDLRVTSGQSIRSLVGDADTAVVLLYDPGDCFTCSSSVAAWMEVRRQRPSVVHILFTRSPSETEKHQLTLYRIIPNGVLRRTPQVRTPVELLVVGGSVVDERTSGGDSLALLARFR